MRLNTELATGPVTFDYGKMKERKDTVISKIRKSLESLILSNGITILRGQAEFLSPREIKIRGQDNAVIQRKNNYCHRIRTSNISPLSPAITNGCLILHRFSSSLTELPKTLAIIGGGYIGCEFASLFADLGVKVIILEALPSIVVLQGATVANALTQET